MGQKLISAAEAVNEIRKNGNKPMSGFFGVTFTKKNGDSRDMTCKLGVKKFLKTVPGKPSTTSHIPKYITVWDVNSKGYRNVNVRKLQGLRINGQSFMVA